MIGASSMWPKAFFLIVFSILAVVLINDWSQAAKRKIAVTLKLLFGSVIFVVWSLLFIQLFVREAKFHHDLIGLRSATIESIEVGSWTLGDLKSISEVVNSLNQAQWFESNHGGWADEVPFVIHFRSGEQRTYHVALYLRQEGAVLISMSNFGRPGRGAGWSNGIAFCPKLPAALAASGVDLPRIRR